MKNKYKELVSNTAVFAFGSILSKAILMFLLPLYTHCLSTEEYGAVEIATNMSLLAIPIASLAIQEAVFRFTVDKSIANKLVFKNMLLVLILGIFILLGLSTMLCYYAPLSPWRWWFWIFSALSMIRSSLSLYVKGTGKTTVFAIDGVLFNAALASFNILFLYIFRLKIEGYFSAIICAQTISTIFLLLNCEKPELRDLLLNPYDYQTLILMLQYSMPLIINSISWNITHTVDRIMIEQINSTSEVGLYSAAIKVPSIISTIINVFIQAWSISAIKTFHEREGRQFYEQVFEHVQALLFIVTIVVLLINNRVLAWLFGSKFEESLRYTPVLMLATSVLFYANFTGPIFSSVNQTSILTKTTMLGTIINIVLNYFLIKLYGVYGACIATLISNGIISTIRLHLARRIKYFRIEWEKMALGWTLTIIACVATLAKNSLSEIIVTILLLAMLLVYRKMISGLLAQARHAIRR